MGLAEKRIAAAYEKDKFPTWKTKIAAASGVELAYDVSFEPLVKEGFLESYPNTIDYNFFVPLERAIRQICADDMGKSAFSQRFKKIRITCDRNWSPLQVKVTSEAIHLDADPSYNRDESIVGEYTKKIVEEVEKAL